MRKKLSHVFRGNRWTIEFGGKLPNKWDGSCDAPSTKGKQVKIRSSLPPKRMLETIIHESLHCLFWDTEDPAIAQSAEDICRLLWRLGYRNINDEKPAKKRKHCKG
jgi:malate synthase